ncbi:hypothetical protein ASE01_03335 [Nocardioides sp. Root190]|nr:hypothetical protein ASE01_03335 [Nocardioides sp. Root190]
MSPQFAPRPPDDQIRAILGWDTFRWAVDHLPAGVSIDDVRFVDLISVTREDVDRWVERHGFATTSVRDDRYDGAEALYLLPEDDGWVVFYSERGQRSFAHHFAVRAEARRWVVDHLYDSARTSLNHRWWHAHPDARPSSIGTMP